MDCEDTSGLFLLTDEKFDFDVSLSPASSKGDDEDEDEVFMGPVSYKERCVSVNVGSRLEDGGGGGDGGGVQASWSPLSGDQLEAVCQEAHRLADQLQCGEFGQPQGKGDEPTDVTTDTTTERATDKDDFVQDAESKLCVLDQNATALIPIKRQTFCVQDSPMKHLPPTFQRRLLRGSSTNTASSTRPSSTASSTRHSTVSPASSTRTTTRNGASSPGPGVKPQTRRGLRGKAALSVVLPSKPAAATTSCSTSKSRAEKTRLQPPSKPMGGWRQSPSSRPSSRAESCEDLLSDTASVASDISDSSLNSSLLGKRTLAPPTKSAVRNLSGVKAPSLQRSVTDRKHTSSSSSSVSSCNSSMSLSPAKGKPNSSLNRSLSGPTGPAPSNISRAAAQSRPRRSTVYAAADPASSSAARRGSASAQARKLSEAEGVKATRSTPLKRAQTTPLQATPAKRVSLGGASIPTAAPARLQQSGLKAKSKAEAPILPTTSGGVRGADVSKMLKPKRLTSVSSMDSLPQKPSAGPLTPSAGSCRSLQVKMRRPSALPTPVRRRMSAIPVTSPTGPPPTLARKERTCSPAPTEAQEVRPVDAPDIQPFRLEEEEEPPAAPPTCLPQPDQSENADPGVPSWGQPEPSRNLIELETIDSKRQEILLLDLPAPTLHPQEKLLIDLTNTPDLIRNSIKTCTTSQLIDLSSPLIKWSPEDKRGNNAPLINLSF